MIFLLCLSSVAQASPVGQERDEPTLPSGLGNQPPPLPTGLGSEEDDRGEREDRPDQPEAPVLERLLSPFTGFWEARAGIRLRGDANQRDTSLAETRLQLSRDQYFGEAMLRLTADFIYDDVIDSHRIRLERGRGWLDLREAFLSTSLGERVDLRLGRQALTWGVGDLLFLNDLFPKDWNSFFAGRDVEYLKAPSDAVRASIFLPAFNIDLVFTPRFDPDRYLYSGRLSLFDPRIGEVVGGNADFDPLVPDNPFADAEWALRAQRLVGSWELAAYGYRGYWKSPEGFDPATGRPVFPKLAVWGGSIRGPLHTGILSAETAWYRSREEQDGTSPFLPNSQFRFLAGYEQELVKDLTLGAQYYLERTLNHHALRLNLPEGIPLPDENRHLLTLRLTWLTHAQNVIWSLFTFASPSDEDVYVRGQWSWKATDAWTLSAGFNLFEGRDRDSFFGQFETNSNAYLGVRYGF